METLAISSFIKDLPSAVAILDTNLCFVNHSDVWLEQFCPQYEIIVGKPYAEVFPEFPEKLQKAFTYCLGDKSVENHGEKITYSNESTAWLKWKINAWKLDNNLVGGLIIFLEDVTETERRKELLIKAERVARIGGWEIDMNTNTIFWTEVTKEIHEVPEDYIPNLEEGINFYKEGEHREEITRLISEAISDGTPWDTELIIVTAKGNELWVRAKGEVEKINGQCARIYGTFQDIDEKKKAEFHYLTITERLAIATKGANVGVWDYNVTLNDLVWDDNMYRLYGIEKEDFKGEYEAWYSGLHPDDRENGMKEIQKAISGEKEFDTEFRIVWPNGEIRHIRAIAVTERDADGRGIKMIGTNWDITELKTAQMNLIKSEASFEGAFENSTIGMAQVGLQGQWMKVNRSLCQSLGYTEKEFRKMTFQEMTFPEDLDKDLALLGQVFKGELKSYQIEKRYIHKKGHIVHAMLTVTAVRDIEGKLSHFISQVMDVSSIVKVELRYKETSERLNMATSVANIGIWEYRLEDNLLICNDNMYTIYGIPKDSSNVREDWMKSVHPEDMERVEREFQATILEEKPFSTQFRGVKPTGEIIHIIAFGEAQKNEDGKIIKIVGANWDISELKNAKAMLENSKESFQNTFENATIGMAIVGLDNRWLKVNKSLSDSLGYSQQELLNLTIQDITHSEDMDKSRIMADEVYGNKRDSYQLEKRYIHKNGHPVPVLLNVTVVKDLDGNLSHTIAQIIDLTDKKESEKSLNALVKVTKDQNDSLLNFAHIVSHNLRSHSSNFSMLTGYLQKEESATERKNLLHMLCEASESLNETVLHLNDVVQVKVGATEKMKRVNLYQTIKTVEKNLSLLIQEKNTVCTVDIPKNLRINAIPAYLDSILLNLFTNSIKYSSPERFPEITITSKTTRDKILLTFKDNGLGIDLKRHGKKLFGMYKTFHRNKDAKGIGLFISKNQIEAMNGKIEVESTVDVGTTFKLSFEK